MQKRSYYIINSITLYRLLAAPFLLFLIISRQPDLFKWLLAFSFFTDAIDGYLARRYKVVSVMGAKLDSLGDDLTVIVGIIGLFVFKPEFINQEFIWLLLIFILFIIQVIYAFIRYGKITSFHTWLAKLAAILQGSFLILAFFMPEPLRLLFYTAVAVTALDLVEEIALIFLLSKWKANVKGIYWVLKQKPETLLFLLQGLIFIW
ncbi:MAG TPA: CDP-alcohol phosphatidyltransferase family protein [Chitinophagaceae bacterium]|nr:CDP-alcohol phosphatidyltransferase family protein [Chitinophagaceae bacterium]